MPDEQSLWSFNVITGYWIRERGVSAGTAQQWLAVFQRDEPDKSFKLSYKKPTKDPRPKS